MAFAVILTGCEQATLTSGLEEDLEHASPGTTEASASRSDVIPGWYVVQLADRGGDVEFQARQLVGDGEVGFVYRHAIKGFSARLSPQAVTALERNPNVLSIEPDQVMRTVTSGSQSNPTWGLDRVDQRERPLDAQYVYENTASNVHAYVIDTGIRSSHADFGGRVSSIYFDAFGGNGNDGNGHGTHVAGTVGGAAYGIAKNVTLYAVRVLDNNGSGSTSGVIAGVDWVAARKQANPSHAMVANMSLGGGASTALDDAVRSAVASGVTFVVAAGNGDFIGRQQPACNYSPARVREALTVGATTSTDAKTSWSNYGECVDIFAPGASITSAWHTSNTATNTISGTSMAAPHVAGAAALYLSGNSTASPGDVFSALFDNATKNIVTSSSTANNHLLFTLFGDASDPTDPTDPTDPEDPTDPTDPGTDFLLEGTSSKVRGMWVANLNWSGSSASSFDVFRQGSRIATTSGSTYTDNTSFRGGGSLTYKVCEAGTSTCSNDLTLSF
jgi:subtilisin family serine protease